MMEYLKANEISCRVQQIKENGLSLLLYITSRDAQRRLDEEYGQYGWREEDPLVIDGTLYWRLSVWDKDKGQWITRTDAGSASKVEKEKGKASDALKRTCVKWGIGRELYTAPFIWIPSQVCKIKKLQNGSLVPEDKFHVSYITYSATGEIDELEIMNQRLEIVFKQYPAGKINDVQYKVLSETIKLLDINEEVWRESMRVPNFKKLDVKSWNLLIKRLASECEKKGLKWDFETATLYEDTTNDRPKARN
jgi:hypothetical protein